MTPPSPSEFYRQIHSGNPGDVAFYSRVAQGASHVLELGCGAGRITKEIAQRGTRITGVDLDQELSSLAKEQLADFPNARVVCGDMRTLDPARLKPQRAPSERGAFDRIIIPYNTLYALGGEAGVRACLQVVGHCLAKEGELWFDVYPIDALHEALLAGQEAPPDDDEPVGVLLWNEQRWNVLETSELSPERQYLEATYRAVDAQGQKLATLKTAHDYLLVSQIERLLNDAGLDVLLISGSFAGDPVDDEAEQLVFGARHKQPG